VTTCFYCDRPLRRIAQRALWFKDSPADRETIDHIIPQAAMRRFGRRLPWKFYSLNQIECCYACNNAKGDMDPIYWARNLGPEAVARLAQRLMQMGVAADAIVDLPNGYEALRLVTAAA